MKVNVRNVRLRWPTLFAVGKKGNFSCTLLTNDQATVNLLYQTCRQVAVEKWKERGEATFNSLWASNLVCLKDGIQKAGLCEGYEGQWYVNCSRSVKQSPAKLYDVNCQLMPMPQPGMLYDGCYVNASIDIWAMDDPENGKRICANHLAIRHVADGEEFTTGPSVNEQDVM